MFCEDCGKEMKPGRGFCSNCGARVAADRSSPASTGTPVIGTAEGVPIAPAANPPGTPREETSGPTGPNVPTYRSEPQVPEPTRIPTPPPMPAPMPPTPPEAATAGRSSSDRGTGASTTAAPARRSAAAGVENYYRILNLAPSASPEDMRKAIIKELRLWSNRTNAPQIERRQEAERMVQTLEEAERTLLDPAKKAEYDRKLQTTPEPSRQVHDEDIGPAADLIAEGWRLLIDGQVADALYVATKATEAQGNNPEAWALLAQAKFRWGDIDDAIYEYRRAIKLKPNGDSYYFDLGSVYESVDKYKEALENFEKAVRIKPQETMYRAAIGAIYVKLDMNKEAIEVLEQCVREAPDNSSYQWALAIAYSERAYEGWTYVPAGQKIDQGYYATKKSQVMEAEAYVNKAAALRFEDPELSEHIAKVRTNITGMYARKFTGNMVALVIAAGIGVIGLLTLFSGQASGLLPLLWFGGGAAAYYKASQTPWYKINKRVLAGKGGPASMDLIASAGAQEYGCVIAIFLFVMTAGFTPIMAAWNYTRNYGSDD